MGKQTVTLQDLIRRSRAGDFVGRREQLDLFERNLDWPVEDPRRKFLFSFHGDAGVGKSFLIRQLARVAGQHGYPAAHVDETSAYDVLTAMEALATGLESAGVRCRKWTERLAAYRRRRHELDGDPGAPDGMSSLLTRSATRVGLRMMGDVPVVGAVVREVDSEAVGGQVDRLRVYLSRRFRDREDVRLLLSPVETLTPVFVGELSEAADKSPLALFFDTFERTGAFLEPWLLDLLDGRYGALPANLVITVAGQRPLDPNRWAAFLGLWADTALDVFTTAEATDLLAARGITDERLTEVILEVSGRLPLLVAMLAQTGPASPEEVGDPSGSAVERFLRWEPDERRRTVALDGAFPRWLDADVLAAASGATAAPDDFGWLCRLPFVSQHSDGWRYHDVVRSSMLRLSRRTSQRAWQQRHLALAGHHRAVRDALDPSGVEGWRDDRWHGAALEEHYHLLCARSTGALPRALEGLIDAYAHQPSAAARWAQMIAQAGTDTDLPALRERGERLAELAGGTDEDHLRLLAELAGDTELDGIHRGTALAERGEIHRLADRLDDALADFNRAIELDPDDAWAIAGRALTYRQTGRYDDALTDYDRAIQCDQDSDWTIAGRGETHRLMNNHNDALTDFDRAIELRPDYVWAIASRAQTYTEMGRYDDALTDYDRAIELDPDSAWVIASRAQTYRQMSRYDDAQSGYNHAIEADPDYAWAIAERGELYRLMRRFNDALSDFDRAIGLDPCYHFAVGSRAQTYRQMSRYDEALTDHTRAIELDPSTAWAIAGRGETHRLMHNHNDALTDFDRAIELDPDYYWAIASRAQTYWQMGRYDDALTDYDRLVELDSANPWPHLGRGLVAIAQGRAAEGRSHLERAVLVGTESARTDPVEELFLVLYLLAAGRPNEARERMRPELVRQVDSDTVEDLTSSITDVRDVLGPIDGLDELLALLTNQPA